MKKIIRLTESDLARIVRRVINESEESTSKDNKIFCINNVKQWEDIDDDVKQNGTWKLSGNKINLYYGGTIANISRSLGLTGDIDATLVKPNGFDQWKGSSVYGKFDKVGYNVCLSK
jgi:hypothetical protein